MRITAPEVGEERVVRDQLRLAHDGFGPFGPELSLSIRVVPRDGGARATRDAGAVSPPRPRRSGGLSSGCSSSGAPPGPVHGVWLWLAIALSLIALCLSRRAER